MQNISDSLETQYIRLRVKLFKIIEQGGDGHK